MQFVSKHSLKRIRRNVFDQTARLNRFKAFGRRDENVFVPTYESFLSYERISSSLWTNTCIFVHRNEFFETKRHDEMAVCFKTFVPRDE